MWRAKWLYLALLVPVAMLLIFEWLPAFSALYNSLYIWNGGKVHFYVGLEHYERMLSDRTFRVAITNLVGFVFFRVIMQTVLPFFAAEMIISLRSARWSYWWKIIFVFPMVVPTILNYLIWRYIINSVLYSGSTICLIACIASVAGYVFARFRFPLKTALFLGFITLIMVPGVLTLAPRFVLVPDLGLVNTPGALISVRVSGGLVLSTWLMRSYFESLPQELFDAAYVDGAAEWQVFVYVSVPLARPMSATVAMTTLIGTWNDLIWPLVTITDKDKMPLALGLMQFSSDFETDWGTLFAGYVISSVPLLCVFAVAMRQFISGLTSGSIKA